MKKNMSNYDRALRVVIALVVFGLYFAHILTGTLGVVLMTLAIVFLLTSLIGSCPIYSIIGKGTKKENKVA